MASPVPARDPLSAPEAVRACEQILARAFGVDPSNVKVDVMLSQLHPEVLREIAARYVSTVSDRPLPATGWRAAEAELRIPVGERVVTVLAMSVDYQAPTEQEVVARWSPAARRALNEAQPRETDVESRMCGEPV